MVNSSKGTADTNSKEKGQRCWWKQLESTLEDVLDVLQSLPAFLEEGLLVSCEPQITQLHHQLSMWYRVYHAYAQNYHNICMRIKRDVFCFWVFYRQFCFEQHNHLPKIGAKVLQRTIFSTVLICLKCFHMFSVVQREGRKNTHQCGSTFCKSCKLYVLPDEHKSYMKGILLTMSKEKVIRTLLCYFIGRRCSSTRKANWAQIQW